MGGKKSVGVFHEKRGNDYFTVHKTLDGDVLEIEQYDANAAFSHTRSVDFFTESAPSLIKLIQKAAGIKPEKVEYEYNIEYTDLRTGAVSLWRATWEPKKDWLKEKMAETYDPEQYSLRLVKRVKAGEVEDA